MQSLTRAIKRGKAYLYYDHLTKSVEVMRKRGADRRLWLSLQKNRLPDAEQRLIEQTPKPIRRHNERESLRIFAH